MKKTITLAFLGISFLASTAHAENGYFGFGVGSATYSEDDFEESDTGLNIFAGIKATENLGVEISYMDFGKQEGDFYGYDASVEITGIGFSAVGFLPLGNNVDLFGKLGLLAWDVDIGLGGFSDSDDGSDLLFGFGAVYHFNEQFSLRGAWDFVDLDGADLDMLSINAQINF